MGNSRAVMKVIFQAVLLCSLSACANYQAGPLSETLDAQSQGTLWFTSNDGYDFSQYATAPELIVEGDLVIPPNHNGATVILSHGSGGVGIVQTTWQRFLNDHGYATFLLDHFSPRNTINVLHSQVRVTEQQMSFDVLNAFKILRTHPNINPDRIFHIGWSKGATTGILASLLKVQGLVSPEPSAHKIAGFIEFYPWCGVRAELQASSPILILHGKDDDYTPLKMCEVLVQDMKTSGSNIQIERFANAVHGFDNWFTPPKQKDSITVRKTTGDCTLRIDPKTLNIRSVSGEFTVDTYDNRKTFLKACAERGVMYGGSPQHQDRTEKLVLDFLAK